MTRILLAGLRIHFVQLSRSAFDIVGVTLWPILYATIAYYTVGSGGGDAIIAAALGVAVRTIWSSVITGSSGALDLQRWLGTLELLVAAPAPLVALVAPITIATAAIGVYALASTFAWSWLFFGMDLRIERPILFVVSVAAAVISIGMLGMILAATMILYRAATFLGNSLQYPGWLVTGLLVPLALLPSWVQPISWVLAPTWGFRAMRDSALGGAPLEDLALCLTLSVAYCGVAMVCLRWFERLARDRGTLALA